MDADLGKNSKKLTVNKDIDYEVTKTVSLILQAKLEVRTMLEKIFLENLIHCN